MIADQDELGARRRGLVNEAKQIGVVGHTRLVQHDQGAGVEQDRTPIDTGQQRGNGERLHAGVAAHGLGSLPRGRGADDPHALPLAREPNGLEHGRLARPGHAHHDLKTASAPADPHHR